ncbi:MAG: hypothetical protein K6C07_02855 [Bacteroidales bacterium]|nr:hypothetical protein [Bacteroidales bacterium]
MNKEIEITVKDGEKEYNCKVRRPDVATLSRVNKLSKADEVLAAQEMLKSCWVSGDMEIQNDAYMMMAAVGQMGELSKGVTAELKN